jgi:RNA-binding protein 26
LTLLHVQAAGLGLPEAMTQPARGSTFRPYRARGRGGRFFTTRGGRSRASMTLDNRPKSLLVKGVPEDKMDVLNDWYGVS